MANAASIEDRLTDADRPTWLYDWLIDLFILAQPNMIITPGSVMDEISRKKNGRPTVTPIDRPIHAIGR